MTTWKDLTPEQRDILERFVVQGDITDIDLLEALGLTRYLHHWHLTDDGWNCLMSAPWMAEGKQAGPFAEAIAANMLFDGHLDDQPLATYPVRITINPKPLPAWISIQDRLPENSDKVLITDGASIATANYFGIANETARRALPGEHWWANQHHSLHGTWIEKPTHWMPCADLLLLAKPDA